VDPPLFYFLEAHKVEHLQGLFVGVTLKGYAAEAESKGRSWLLGDMKERGVTKLAERQSLANAISKANKEGRLEDYSNWPPLPKMGAPDPPMSMGEFEKKQTRVMAGDTYKLTFPFSMAQVRSSPLLSAPLPVPSPPIPSYLTLLPSYPLTAARRVWLPLAHGGLPCLRLHYRGQ
jgi:hypothetical protein